MNVENAFIPINNFDYYKHIPSNLIVGDCLSKRKDIIISIVIPTYNRGNLLCDAIESAVNQKFDNQKYEIIIVDNDSRSNNETEQNIKLRYAHVPNLKYYKNAENLGLFGNWNRCFELACGHWIILLHDDDLLYENFIHEVMAEISKMINPPAILKPEMRTWDSYKDKKPLLKEKRSKLYLKFAPVKAYDYVFLGNYIGSPTGCVFERDKVLSLGGFNINLYPSADTMFMLYMATKYNVLLYRRTLGVRRIGYNETFKSGVLDSFIESRFTVTQFLIQYYKLSRFIPKDFAVSQCKIFYKEIRNTLKADFQFDFTKLELCNLKPSIIKTKIISKFFKNIWRLRILAYNTFHRYG